MITVEIPEDFDIAKIADSGQCFRAVREGDRYRFVTRDRVLYIEQTGVRCSVSCPMEEWERFWIPYFDLMRDYATVRSRIGDPFLQAAAEYGKGIRILKQDPWEMLISFILSQRKSIPAIRNAVERLCERFGTPLPSPGGAVFAFPTPKALHHADEEELYRCGLGYRTPYVRDAARKVYNGEIDLAALALMPDSGLSDTLKTIRGVGDKVSSCIMLFAYGRTACVPVDTWIGRIIRQYGKNPFEPYGADAGILQQYAFYYLIHDKTKAARASLEQQGVTPIPAAASG